MTTELPDWELTPRQQFGRGLNQLRVAAGMQSQDVAALIGMSPDSASRFGRGERWPREDAVRKWAVATGRPDAADGLTERLGELRQLESRLRAEEQAAKLAQDLRSKQFGKAAKVSTFAITDIPYYLQTAEYAKQSLGDVAGAAEVVEMRRKDHDAVGAAGKEFDIILAESALRLFPCDARTMQKQLSDLQGLVDTPGVAFGIIPFGVPVPIALRSSFSIFGEITIAETFAGAIDLTAKSAQRYRDLMERLGESAVRDDEARALLVAAIKALPAS